MIRKSKILVLLEYIIAGVIVLNCRTIWSTKYPPVLKFDGFLWLTLFGATFLIIILNFKQNKDKLQYVVLLSFFLFLYFGLFIIISNFPGTRNYGVRYASVFIILIWLLYYDRYNNGFPQVLLKYKNLIFVVAIVSLIFWLLGSILGLLKPTAFFQTTWTGTGKVAVVPSYYGIYFETQSVTTAIGGFIRNSAIYPEAPMSSLNFCIALGIQTFSMTKSKWSKLQFVFLVLAILSTGSTTGYIFLTVLLAFKLNTSDNETLKKYKTVFFALIIILAAILVGYLFHQKTIYGTDSTNIRLDDYKVGYRAWIQNPIFGSGIENDNYLRQFMDSWRSYNTGFSNAPFKILSDGGLYIFIGYVYCFVKGISSSIASHNYSKLIFILLVLYLFCTTIFQYTYLLFGLLIWFTMKNAPKN